MTPIPPPGSKITVRIDDGDPVVVIPSGSAGLMRYGVGLFLLCWLGGWTVGLFGVSWQLLSGRMPLPAAGFTLFWLCAWTVGGVLVAYQVYRIFRPSVPETLRLRRGSLLYDSGVAPFPMNVGYAHYRDRWKSAFPKRTIVEIDRKGLQTLRLRDTDSDNRLTVDVNATRLVLAVNSTEIEREWLYQVLVDRYALESRQASKP
jgi:hypothetical protein